MATTAPLTPATPKATLLADPQEPVAALCGSEEISGEAFYSLQAASGIHAPGLDMTIFLLESRLSLVLDGAWWDVRQTLIIDDLWIMAQVAQNLDDSAIGMNDLEWFLREPGESEIDPEGARELLLKVRTWSTVTRWAVLRAAANGMNAARKRSVKGHPIPNRLIEDEFRKALTA